MKRLGAWIGIAIIPLMASGIFYGYFYTREKSLDFEGVSRKYWVHVPVNLGEKPAAVIALHGYGDHPRLMELYSGLSQKADQEKFVVVYPTGTKGSEDNFYSWNGGSCCGAAVDLGVDDVGFVRALADEVVSTWGVDEKKIFVTGFSNGALLVHRLAYESGEKFAGFAVVAGATSGKRSQDQQVFGIQAPDLGVWMMLVHGDQDVVVPFGGGFNRVVGQSVASFGSFDETVKLWAEANRCGTNRLERSEKNYTKAIFPECTDGQLTTYVVHSRGHVWPGGFMELTTYGFLGGLKTTDEMWEFFSEKIRLGVYPRL